MRTSTKRPRPAALPCQPSLVDTRAELERFVRKCIARFPGIDGQGIGTLARADVATIGLLEILASQFRCDQRTTLSIVIVGVTSEFEPSGTVVPVCSGYGRRSRCVDVSRELAAAFRSDVSASAAL